MNGRMDQLMLFVGVPVGLFALMVCSLWLGLGWDRARGRLRCPKCWYDRHDAIEEGGEIGVCPECGFKPRRPKDLERTRRSRPLVLLGVSLAPVIVWWVGALLGGRGLLWPLPDGVLVRLHGFSAEAVRGSWVDQLLRTEVGARRTSGRWSMEMDARLARGVNRRPLVSELNVPARWPAGTPVPVLIDGDAMIGPYLPSAVAITVESGGELFGPFTPRDLDVRRVFASAGAARPLWVFFAPPAEAGELRVDVQARWRAGRGNTEEFLPETVDESQVFRIEDAPDLSGVLPEAPETVTDVLRKGWLMGMVRGGVNVTYPEDPAIEGVSLGMSVELWCGEILVASGRTWLPNFAREPMTTGQYCEMEDRGAAVSSEQMEKGPWSWRVRSDPTWGAIGAQLGSTSAWVGEFERRTGPPSARWLQYIRSREAREERRGAMPR